MDNKIKKRDIEREDKKKKIKIQNRVTEPEVNMKSPRKFDILLF